MAIINAKRTKMNNYFSTRHTVRTFSKRNINDATLKEMLEAAAHAPTTGNMQLYSVIITRDEEIKNKMASAHFSQPAYMNAPVVLTFCADFNRFVKWCEISGADPGYDNIQSFIAAALDTTIIAQQFVTIAEMNGLGTCYLGTTTYNPDIISNVLELPDLVVPIITVAVGYPEGEITESDRISVDGFVHKNTYHDYNEESIKAIYTEKESRADSKQFVKENGKTSLAQVFTDVRYPRQNNEHFSRVFVDFLKEKKFLK